MAFCFQYMYHRKHWESLEYKSQTLVYKASYSKSAKILLLCMEQVQNISNSYIEFSTASAITSTNMTYIKIAGVTNRISIDI